MSASYDQPLAMLQNLLARIHRDGGHHTELVGVYQSYLDADSRVADLNVLADEQARRVEPVVEIGDRMTNHDPGDAQIDPVPGVRG